MDREQVQEFAVLRDTVIESLRGRTSILRDKGLIRCQYLMMPSAANMVCWDVLERSHSDGSALIRLYRSCWRMDLDMEAMRTPVERLKYPYPYAPTIETGWRLLIGPEFQSIMDRCQVTRVPLSLPTRQVGLDGTNYELSFGDPFCNLRLHWWCHIPEGWSGLHAIVTDLISLFEMTWERGHG